MSDDREVPPPVWTSRDGWPADVKVPGVAAKLMRGVEAAGWEGRATYAQGYVCPPKLADPPYPVATVAVRFHRDFGDGKARGGYVVYHCRLDRAGQTWVAKSLLVFGSDHWPVVTGLNVTEVGRYLVDGADWSGAAVGSWADQLKAKVAERREKASDAAKAKRLELGGRGRVI